MKITGLARALYAPFIKSDAELSFEEFKIRRKIWHPERTDKFLSEIYDYITHRAFRNGKPFHEDGFARRDLASGTEKVSDRFVMQGLDNTTSLPDGRVIFTDPEPKNYYSGSGFTEHLWLPKIEFAYGVNGWAQQPIHANNRGLAKSKLKGQNVTFLEPASDAEDTFLQTLGKSFSWRSLRNSSARVNMARAVPLMALAGAALLGYAGYNLENYSNNEGKRIIAQGRGVQRTQVPQSVSARKIVQKEVVPGHILSPRVAVMPQIVSTNLPATNHVSNKVLYESKEKAPIEVVSSPKKSVILEARRPYDKPQTQQVYRAATSLSVVKTNRLERVVDAPKTHGTNVVQKPENPRVESKKQPLVPSCDYFVANPLGNIKHKGKPLFIYTNALAQANELPFIFSESTNHSGQIFLVPTISELTDLTFISSGESAVRAKYPNLNVPANDVRTLNSYGIEGTLPKVKFGGSFYISSKRNPNLEVSLIDAKEARALSNERAELTLKSKIYSTKPISRGQYLQRKH